MGALENNFQNLVKARDILINNRKVDNETKKWAYNFMTDEIREYRERKVKETEQNMAINNIINIDNALQNIILKRKAGDN